MRRKNRVESLLNGSGDFDAFIIKSPADIAYLIGIIFPYPDQSPFSAAMVASKDSDKYTLILPAEWECVLRSFTWKGKAKVYSINDGSPDMAFRGALKAVIEEMGICQKAVALDYPNWTAGEIKFIKEACPEITISDLNSKLCALREIKSADEIANIKAAAHIADRGMIGALNHVEGTVGNAEYTLAEFLERIRVHAIEFGANTIGHLNLSQGSTGHSWITPIDDFSLVRDGNTIRADYSMCYNGCWASCSRMFYVGKPDHKAREAYAANMLLKDFAVSILKPGLSVSEFCDAVRTKAEEEGIELLYDDGLGHGVGMSEYEMPFLTEDNTEELKAGMVIALDVRTLGGKNEIIHSVDIYALTQDGNVRLSDFRDWNKLYKIDGVRTTH